MKNCILLSILLIGFLSCAKKTTPTNKMTNTASTIPTPAWAKNAIIYEVNIRQYSKEGNFDSFKKHLNRLKNLGVDIIWFMPIYPISEVGRKGTLGSPYAVADYKKVNPNYGTMDDFKSLVQTIHNMGMKVIIDWVPNHTGWDNVWIKEHPDWYTHVGEAITHPLNNDGSSTGWTDVADLNYNNKAMRKAMIEAMTFWLKTTNIDGFRVDMSGMVPDDFWQEARPSLLAANKNIFMLSEWEDAPDHFSTFHVNYGWQLHHTTAEIAKGIKKPAAIWEIYHNNQKRFPKNADQLLFVTNHDENSWNGTAAEKFGAAEDAFVVMNYTFAGIPLIYSGQEIGNNKRLSFFDKDEIYWLQGTDKAHFYKKLAKLKHENPALANGQFGVPAIQIPTNNTSILAYSRESGNNRVVVLINCSSQKEILEATTKNISGAYSNFFKEKSINLDNNWRLAMEPYEYIVLIKK